MEVTQFTFKVVLVFIPGIIAHALIDKLTTHKEYKVHQIVINSLIYGFASYFGYYLVTLLPCPIFHSLPFSLPQNTQDNFSKIDFTEIGFASLSGVIVGLIFSLALNRKWIHFFAQKAGITKKFGDVDVWGYIMNAELPEWVIIRDIKNDLMYEGWIQAFSDGNERDELFLRDVKVFRNSTGEELYAMSGIYIAKKREDLIVEFRSLV